MKIGDYIRDKRESLKISQEAVAYSLDISQAAYSKIERNETKVKVEQIYKIANCLGISVYEILPPTLASDMTHENIFSLIYFYILKAYKTIFGKK